jgi:hypothetical protein
MKVVEVSNLNHEIIVVPRYYTTNSIDLVLFNEATKETVTYSNAFTSLNGYLTYPFTHTFFSNDKYQIKLVDGTKIVYRGKLIATDQIPQDYKLTNGLYTYE